MRPEASLRLSAPALARASDTEHDCAADDAWFDAFYRQTAPGLWRYLARLGGDGELAADVLQESFLRLAAPRDAPLSHPKAYLYRVATNLLRDRWRNRRRERDRVEAAVGESEPSAPPLSPQALDLRRALHELPQRQRALVWLAHAEGMEHREIAEILGLSPGSVRVLLHRARRSLHRLLETTTPEITR